MKHISLLLLVAVCLAQGEETDTTKPALMERLVKSIPQIPNVIKGQMEGKPEELKKMISSMLGDGLLSQLVVNPISVAENMGVPLNGLNQTALNNTLNLGAKPTGNGKDTTSPPFDLFGAFFTTPSTSTTPKVMYVDGVPIKNFDEFIRNHNLEDKGYSTSAPPVTTTPFSPERVAEVVLERLKSKETPVLAEPPRQNDITNNLDMNLIDPSRVAEVNRLLRRAPQRFEPTHTRQMNQMNPMSSLGSFGGMGPMDPMADMGLDAGPPGFSQSLDPAIDEVVTNLRTKGAYGLSVDDVKRLQNILQTYEQTIQTKELLSKRKQLQVLQTELGEQRKRIEVQRKMETELRKKEQELEEAKKKMEEQLKDQLSSWHSSFGPNTPRPSPPPLPQELLLETMGSPPAPISVETTTTAQEQSFVTAPEPSMSSSHERKLAEEREEIVEQQMMPVPPPAKISSALRNHIRYSPTPIPKETVPESTSVQRDDDEFVSKCDCEKISLDKMDGKWLMALASSNVLEIMKKHTSTLLDQDSAELTCSRFDISAGKQSIAAQDARLIWQFKTVAPKLFRLRGNALTMDHESIRVQIADFEGDNFSFPFCVLKSGGTSHKYEHMLVTNSQGNCKDVALLVRDPQEFFDNPDKKLQKYLKTKIAKKEMNSLGMVNFGDC